MLCCSQSLGPSRHCLWFVWGAGRRERQAAGRAFLRHVPASWGFSDGQCGGEKASDSLGSGFLGCLAGVPVIP